MNKIQVLRKPPKLAHKLIYATAIEMAGALYEEMLKDNALYASWKAQNPGANSRKLQARFCRKMAPHLFDQARATLAKMLAGPYDPATKDTIAEALLLDNTARLRLQQQ